MIQSLRVLEGAASLALLFSPEEAKQYLERLGLNEQDIERACGIEPAINVHHLREMQEKLDAQRRRFKKNSQ